MKHKMANPKCCSSDECELVKELIRFRNEKFNEEPQFKINSKEHQFLDEKYELVDEIIKKLSELLKKNNYINKE